MARQISTTTVGFRFLIRDSYYDCGFQLLLAKMVVIVVGVLCFISSNDGTSGCRFRFYCRRRELHQFHISGFTMHKDFCSSCGSWNFLLTLSIIMINQYLGWLNGQNDKRKEVVLCYALMFSHVFCEVVWHHYPLIWYHVQRMDTPIHAVHWSQCLMSMVIVG